MSGSAGGVGIRLVAEEEESIAVETEEGRQWWMNWISSRKEVG